MVPAIVTLLTGLGAISWLTATTLPSTADALHLPEDGHVAQAVTTDGDLVQLEHAVLPIGLLDSPLTRRVLAEDGLEPTSTALRVSFAPRAAGNQMLFLAADDRLTLRGFTLDGVGRVFLGGLALEAGAVAGEVEVAGHGTVGYSGRVTAAPAGDGCDEIEATLDVGGAPETIATTLCEAAGPTAFRVDLPQQPGGPSLGFAPTSDPVPFLDTTLEVPDRDWTAAATWEPTAYTPTAVDAFGEVVGTSGLVGSPAALLGGQVAVPDRHADDVVVLQPGSDGVAVVAWRGHPGGHVVQVIAVGDLVVAVRAGGSMVAYSVDGVRIWESDAATESVVGSVVGVTGRLTFATLDGRVWMLDAATGETMWSHRFAERLGSGVVADERVTFAFDTEGGMVGYAASGEQAFDGDVPAVFTVVALDEANSYLAQSQVIEAYELQHSQFQWATDVPGAATAMCSTEDRLVVLTWTGTYELDPVGGAIVASREPGQAIECGRGAVAVASGRTIEVWPSAGGPVTLQLPAPAVGLDFRTLAPAPDGLWVVADEALVWWAA